MHVETLESRCVELYGETEGRNLYHAMRNLNEKDFCVATGWAADEVSLAKTCTKRGRIFKLTRDYRYIKLPDGKDKLISNLVYSDLAQFLPNSSVPNFQHCAPDKTSDK